mmetsp:Transcript_50680/g.107987  ORF Transcript_50680/g.107987 Transcript_50680/m.107987 type:complete len:644 (-) Transcript_50680:48-1979(-)|eukprot:CAMPEP_0172552024 /NCGR_PEP_ID=MMETSP1067-20121228/43205_1 /TAXON_ID=265564 ORGANISM="Thalassiosira punctigera, Strain Tpunct2005C2" /NCGR_SAMPLE_ID=MMETSP1067 /ASSEMBLY_ACC=CAM_ASM_000444 /LENGTH=643 /DNA_ID=CAMNT_0013339929 /DNA_START=126 /DNA_END=2057 /DNA_ORIENTATION=+
MAKASILAIFLASVATFASSKKDSASDQCGVYLAESSTDHVLGSFAGKPYHRDDAIGSRDAIVQFVDIRENNRHLAGEDDGQRLENFLGTCWSGDATGGMSEGDEVISAVGGPCFSSTGHVGMINAVIYQPATLLRTDSDLLSSGYDEATSPGYGAFTTYHNLTLLAVDKIPEGMELFLDFGMEYNRYDDTTKPNLDDYRKMDEAMEKMVEFFNKHAENLGEKAASEVYEFMKKDVLDLTAEKRAPAARSLLPDTYHGLQEIIDRGGSALFSNPEVVKDLDWLKMNGYCQDNLVVGVSTIEHAGRGAFASRHMKKGEVVSAMPLVALNQGREALAMVESEEDAEEYGTEASTRTHQLLYNYMLEHPQSSALFLPAGAMTFYINHGGKKKANVKMMWSTKEWSNVEGAHETDLDDLSLVGAIDMILELVATRPIKKGEEVLLDYGDDWANAWNEHVSKWNEATKDATHSKSAMVLNEIHHSVGKPAQPFPTIEEAEGTGAEEDEHAMLQCHLLYDEDKIERRRNQDGTRTKVYPWIPYPVAGESRLKTESAFRGVNRVGCDILERSGDAKSGYKYVVRPRVGEGPGVLVKNVPHYAIRYADKPYRNGQHGLNAFRHAIQFPDEIFPDVWRDLSYEEGHGANDEL